MFRKRIFRLAVATIVTVGMSAALGTVTIVNAGAVTRSGARVMVPAVQYSCTGFQGTPARQCYFQTQNGHAPLFNPNGSLFKLLPLNDKVLVTCWYDGDPSAPYLKDGVLDHVVWENGVGNHTGHIPDSYIAEGNKIPADYPYDILACG